MTLAQVHFFIEFSSNVLITFCVIVPHRIFVSIRICWRTGRRNKWRKGDNFLFRSGSPPCMKSLNTLHECLIARNTIANLPSKLQKEDRKLTFLVPRRSEPWNWFTLFCFCCLHLAIWHWTMAVGLYYRHFVSLTIDIIAVICPRFNQLSMFVNYLSVDSYITWYDEAKDIKALQ